MVENGWSDIGLVVDKGVDVKEISYNRIDCEIYFEELCNSWSAVTAGYG